MLHGLLVFSLGVGLAVLLLAAVNLAVTPRLSRCGRLSPPGQLPSVSVVMPARNEEREIEAAVRAHLVQDYPSFEVLVVDDLSTDRTPEILGRLARGDARLRIVAGEEPPPGWLGKPHALHLGARAASGTILLFADADVRYDPRALREAVTLLEAKRIDFLALIPRFVTNGFWENVLMPNIPLTYFFGVAALANNDRVRGIAAGGGAGNLVRRSTYEAIGGHAAIRSSVIDDIRLALLAKRSGFRCRAARAEDRVSVRMYRGFREIWNGFTKNVAFLFEGRSILLALPMTLFSLIPSLVPPLALVAAGAGAPIERGDVALAAAAAAVAILARAVVALALGDPVWPSPTNPLMMAVWAGIIGRSLYWKLVRKEVLWRGRRYDAQRARF